MKKLIALLKSIDNMFKNLFDSEAPDASFVLHSEII